MTLPSDLPNPSAQRLALRITADALRQVRGGHPWVFESSIRSVSRDGSPGDLAVIFGDRREFVAIGLWDPSSPIRVRVLHRGSPATIDGSFWRARLTSAMARRSALIADPGTTGYRLVHGENDALPGLVADLYDTTLVLKLYSDAWFPHLTDVVEAVADAATATGVRVETVVLRLSRNVQRLETFGLRDGSTLIGSVPDRPVLFLENGLTFEADVLAGQKTGHFLDQRENRARVRELASGRVLDVFACTGGFSVNAAAGGAAEVHSVDLSRRSLATASANMAHNADRVGAAGRHHHVVVGDAFDVMGDLRRRRERFDVVIVDPPSFAPRERDRAGAIEAYRRLAGLGLDLVVPGGTYVQSSCSSRVGMDELRAAVVAGSVDVDRRLLGVRETGHPADHPIGFPQGGYLTTVFATVEPGR